MIRNLLFATTLLCAASAGAQVVPSLPALPPKTTQIVGGELAKDWKEIGAPMPPLKMLTYGELPFNTTEPAKKDKKKKDEKAGQIGQAERVPLKKEDLNTLMTFGDFNNGANLFVMMFNPTCSHCEDMTAQIEKNISLFKKSKVVLLATMMMKDYLPDFVNMLHVQDYPAIKVGLDSGGFINNVFLYQTLPQINIYDGERKLLKTYSGEVSMDTLKKYIE